MSQELFNRIERALTLLVLDHPYLGHLCSKLDFVADPDGRAQGTMATDGRKVYVDIEYCSALNDAELLGICAHEILHPGFLHHTRRGHRDPGIWNDACDYEINPFLLSEKFELPKGGLVDPAFADKTAEQIYPILEARAKNKQPGGKQGNQGNQPGQGPQQPGQGQGKPAGRVLDAPDKEKDEAEWQVNIIQATKCAQMMGKLPGGMKAIVDRLLKPVVDWRSELRQFLQQTSQNDYSFDQPDRRFMRMGMYLPDMKSDDEMGEIVNFWDSSGSTLEFREVFLTEFSSLVQEMRPERVHLIMVDAEVQAGGTRVYERDEPIEDFEIHGMGGTSFKPGFVYVENNNIRPVCAVYLTDCIGDYPTEPPEYPVLWLCTTSMDQIEGTQWYPPFGRVVPIEEHDR